jgi:hypothetical protein
MFVGVAFMLFAIFLAVAVIRQPRKQKDRHEPEHTLPRDVVLEV